MHYKLINIITLVKRMRIMAISCIGKPARAKWYPKPWHFSLCKSETKTVPALLSLPYNRLSSMDTKVIFVIIFCINNWPNPMISLCSGDRVAARMWHHYSASSTNIQVDWTWVNKHATEPPDVVYRRELKPPESQFKGERSFYRAGAKHGFPCTEVILCIVSCV